MKSEVRIGYGAIMPMIEDQLKEQGLQFINPGSSKTFQYQADAIVRLHLSGILTDGEVDRARQRLQRSIAAAVEAQATPAPETTKESL